MYVSVGFEELDNLFAIETERNRIQFRKQIVSKKSCSEFPSRLIVPMTTDVLAADTGPEGGVQCLSVQRKELFNYFHGQRFVSMEPIAGVTDWNKHHHKAFGLSQSLYEVDPGTKILCGEPNADAFAVVARENNAFLAVADGVNWGEKPFMAARSAVKGCIEYLSNHLHEAGTTREIVEIMLRSFKHAQECIIDCEATLTTLCSAVICKLQGIDCYGLCTVNVGDSLVYVYRKKDCVQEVSIGSHKDETSRDMRTTGGCLGPSDGYNPDLTNLTCSFALVEEGDIVFLTTDGISDNFDPVVLKWSEEDMAKTLHPLKPSKSDDVLSQCDTTVDTKNEKKEMMRVRSQSVPIDVKLSDSINENMINKNRHLYARKLMKQQIESSKIPLGDERSAKELCANLMNFVVNSTREKRMILEDGTVEAKTRYKESKSKPGKLDHATVVAYEVGHFQPEPLKLTFQRKDTNKRPVTDRSSKNSNDEQGLELYSLLGLMK